MEKTRIKVCFSITGVEFTHQALTERIGLIPVEHWNKGDIIGTKPSIWSFWEIMVDYKETLNLDHQLKKLHEIIKDKIPELIKIKREYNPHFTVVIVVKIENQETPSMHFHQWFIEFLHEIDAEVDIDTYVYS
jgi:hypothetical protein